jgi:hypothetical protein
MSNHSSEADRAILAELRQSNAIDFEAVGAALAKFGTSEFADIDDDGFRFCGTMMRYTVLFKFGPGLGPVSETGGLEEVAAELR